LFQLVKDVDLMRAAPARALRSVKLRSFLDKSTKGNRIAERKAKGYFSVNEKRTSFLKHLVEVRRGRLYQ
jgi:hypothetical protein